MPLRFKKYTSIFHLSISGKLSLAIGAIVSILLLTAVISFSEFRRMSTYVSDLISDNISTINLSTELAVTVDEYNLSILQAVGHADEVIKSNVDTLTVKESAKHVFTELSSRRYVYIDSLQTSFDRYYAESRQLDSIIVNDFVDTRDWYFTLLQPRYNDFRKHMDAFNVKAYDALKTNSVSFDESFYRSIMPSVVSVATAIILCLLLQFFIMSYYVIPLRKILKGTDAYKHNSQNYTMVFEGDDELQALNGNITDIIEENQSLKNRLRHRES